MTTGRAGSLRKAAKRGLDTSTTRQRSEIESPNTAFFYDVSQDRRLTPIDALRVINELIRNNRASLAALPLSPADLIRQSSELHQVAGALADAPTDREKTNPIPAEDSSHRREPLKAKQRVSPNLSTVEVFSFDSASSGEDARKDNRNEPKIATLFISASESDLVFGSRQLEF